MNRITSLWKGMSWWSKIFIVESAIGAGTGFFWPARWEVRYHDSPVDWEINFGEKVTGEEGYVQYEMGPIRRAIHGALLAPMLSYDIGRRGLLKAVDAFQGPPENSN